MATDKKVRVAIVGLGFGAEFIPIYQAHPERRDVRRLPAEQGRTRPLRRSSSASPRRYTDYDELLKDPNIDAVHINSPIPDHAPQTIKALKAGKHVACTVPMATTKDEIKEIVELQRKVGKIYMMMETVVYSREYLFAKDLYDRGVLGRIQFLRGSHQQDMDGWPDYWPGLPPMWYATHCVSPCLAILSDPGAGQERAGRERRVPRLGPHPRGVDPEIRQPVRHRDRDVQDQGLGRGRGGDAEPVRHRPAVPRELRRDREQRQLRVAAGGGRRAGVAHARACRSRRSRGG